MDYVGAQESHNLLADRKLSAVKMAANTVCMGDVVI